MKTIVIVGDTREAAREKLMLMCDGSKPKRLEGYDEAMLDDDHRILAMGGSEDDVCWLVELGFHVEQIIVIEPGGISEMMGRRINHVRSTLEWQRREG